MRLPRLVISPAELRFTPKALGLADAVPLAAFALLVAVLAIGVPATGLVYDGRGIDLLLGLQAALWIVGTATRTLPGGARIGAVLQAFALLSAFSLLSTLVTAVLAVGDRPYVDDILAALDQLLLPGFDWPATMRALAAYPRVELALGYIYTSLNWQPMALFVAIALFGSERLLSRFMTASALSALICVLPFHWLPAVGAYVHFGITSDQVASLPVQVSWSCPASLAALRSGATQVLGVGAMVGIVTVPSFHASAAVLFGWAFSRLPRVRWFFVPLNVAMWVSAVPTGGHYVIDLVAGSAAAVLAIIASGWFERRLGRSVAEAATARMPSGQLA